MHITGNAARKVNMSLQALQVQCSINMSFTLHPYHHLNFCQIYIHVSDNKLGNKL